MENDLIAEGQNVQYYQQPYCISIMHKPNFWQKLFLKFIPQSNKAWWMERFGKYITILDGNNVSHLENYGLDPRVKIELQNGNMTYRQFLGNILVNPFGLEKIYMNSRIPQQVVQTLSFSSFELLGASTPYGKTPTINLFQNQSGSTILEWKTTLNGNSKIRFKILCGASVNIQLYGTHKIANTREINPAEITQTKNP